MRTLVTFMCILILYQTNHAQTISTSVLLQNGMEIDTSHKFLDGEMPTFQLQDCSSGNDIKWTLNILNDGTDTTILESDSGAKTFTFQVSPDLFPPYSEIIEFWGDSSVYVQGYINLYQGEMSVDKLPILFNVLPSRPIIKEASLNGEFDFQEVAYSPFATFDISFTSDRMTDCAIGQFMSDSMYVMKFPESHYMITTFLKHDTTPDGKHEVRYQFADWGQYYQLFARNKYGMVYGTDTIFSNNYISDPDITDAINMLYTNADINESYGNNTSVTFKNNILQIIDDSNSGITTSIFNSNGKPYVLRNSRKTIDLNTFPTGTYIICITKNNKRIIQQKIIKS